MENLGQTYNLLAYVGEGHIHPQALDEPVRLADIYMLSGEHTGAVTQDTANREYAVFDLTHGQVWRFFNKARATAHALWFVR